MKTLNKQATKTLYKLMNLMSEDHYARIDNSNGAFMAVSVEGISENEKYLQISVAHYYEQNGDLMADPEMIFIYVKAKGSFIPCYYKQDGILLSEEESVRFENGEIKAYRKAMQESHCIFANIWMKNIKYQQNL